MKKVIVIGSILLFFFGFLMGYGIWFSEAKNELIFSVSEQTNPNTIVQQWPFDDLWKQSFITGCMIKRLNNISPGKYKITSGMSPIDAVHLLRRKEQIDILVRIDLTNQSDSLFQLLSQEIGNNPSEYQFAFDSVFQQLYPNPNSNIRTTYFFADTYAFSFGESTTKIATRFHSFYHEFWNEERINKQLALGLTREEVYILASMVKGETKIFSEAATIAGLYLNRLKKPMKLQCDATVKYAMQQKKAQRILKTDLQFDSPFNTYIHDGLPPGPIFITEKKYLDAVLNCAKHNFIYMCAADDGSGKHLFTSSFIQHQNNARKYQKYLNELNIKR